MSDDDWGKYIILGWSKYPKHNDWLLTIILLFIENQLDSDDDKKEKEKKST